MGHPLRGRHICTKRKELQGTPLNSSFVIFQTQKFKFSMVSSKCKWRKMPTRMCPKCYWFCRTPHLHIKCLSGKRLRCGGDVQFVCFLALCTFRYLDFLDRNISLCAFLQNFFSIQAMAKFNRRRDAVLEYEQLKSQGAMHVDKRGQPVAPKAKKETVSDFGGHAATKYQPYRSVEFLSLL